MIKVNVISNYNKWKKYLKNPNSYLDKRIKKLNRRNKLYNKKLIFFTLLLSGNIETKNLNKKFRKINKTTDVLSFPFYNKKDLKRKLAKNKEIYLGDIVINLNKIKFKNSKEFNFEFNKLWIHGLIHLLGHDHKKDKDFYNMQILEKKFLSYID
jgi:probable rRNA maturation factor